MEIARMKTWRAWAARGLALAGAAALFFLPRIPQSAAYHNFADQRSLLGLPHALDALSNAGFFIVGAWGLAFLIGKPGGRLGRAFLEAKERRPYFLFFLGVFLTALGSAYYHLAPDSARLVWDRLPMAVGFMALLAAVLSERVNARLGQRLLAPLVLLGIASVLYWRWTTMHGRDDLRPYIFVQLGSLVAVLFLASFWPSRYTRGGDLFVVVGLYTLAKLCELLDRQIFALGGVMSGHTLKHLVAALACYWVLRMLKLREPIIVQAK